LGTFAVSLKTCQVLLVGVWKSRMSLKFRHVAIAVVGMALSIDGSTGSMAAKKASNLQTTEIMCDAAALEKLDDKARLDRIEECNTQTPKLESGTLVAPIPTIVAAKSKGPKLRDKHLRAACPPPKTVLDALTAKRRKGPKGDVDRGCTESNPAPDVPLLKRRKGPKGRSGSDAQG
jgi:hypothetical protein